MRAEIKVRIGGSEHTLAMPLGGLEEVAGVNPVINEVYGALQSGVWRLDELKAVLGAGVKWGKADTSVEAIIDEHGLLHRDADGNMVGGAVKIAADLLATAFRDDAPGNAGAAARKKRKNGNASR